ncbi:MAG: DUF2971 domain-containing protein [Burkholderiales bacterium]
MLTSADENERQLRDPASGSGFLYRYRDLVGPRAEWVRQIIVDSQIYFASPAQFNDPFDCRIRFRTEGPFDELRGNLDQLMRSRGFSRLERRQKIRRVGDPIEFIRKITTGFQLQIDGTGVLSLSSNHENILLWSHYACSHNDVCLQFRVIMDAPFFAPAMPVLYKRDLPVPDLIGADRDERAEQLVFTKAEDWAYEREWRLISPDKAPGARAFAPELLSAIILGAKMPKADINMVTSWVTQRRIPVRLYQAALDPKKYALLFEQIA